MANSFQEGSFWISHPEILRIKAVRQKAMQSRITLGGKLSITYALIWSLGVCTIVIGRWGGNLIEDLVAFMTFPLGLYDGLGAIFSRRGLITLPEVLTLIFLMIPNSFLMGYGIAGFYKSVVPYKLNTCDSTPLSRFQDAKVKKPNKNR